MYGVHSKPALHLLEAVDNADRLFTADCIGSHQIGNHDRQAAGGMCRKYAGPRILEHKALPWTYPQPVTQLCIDFRVGLAVYHLVSAQDSLEISQHPSTSRARSPLVDVATPQGIPSRFRNSRRSARPHLSGTPRARKYSFSSLSRSARIASWGKAGPHSATSMSRVSSADTPTVDKRMPSESCHP